MHTKELGRTPSPYVRQSELPEQNPIPLKKVLNILKIREHIIKHNLLNTKTQNYESNNIQSS